MKIIPSRATPKTAGITGAYCAVVGLALGLLVDAPGPLGTFWLVLAALLVGIPAYFFDEYWDHPEAVAVRQRMGGVMRLTPGAHARG